MNAQERAALFRELLARERQENNWTIEAQAKAYGINPISIYRWEQGIVGKSTIVLLPLLLKKTCPPAEQAA